MRLALKAAKETLHFMKTNPLSLVFMLIVYAALFSNSFLFNSLIASGSELNMGSAASSLDIPITYVALAVVMSAVSFAIYVLQYGTFPSLVYDSLRKKKGVLPRALLKSVKRFGRLFTTAVITNLIVLAPLMAIMALDGGEFMGNMRSVTTFRELAQMFSVRSFAATFLALVAGILAYFYLYIRFWLVYPILMIEDRKAVESIRLSWSMSKGRVVSIMLALVLMLVLILVPAVIMNAVIAWLQHSILSISWGVFFNVYAGTLGGVLTTVYYLNLKKK